MRKKVLPCLLLGVLASVLCILSCGPDGIFGAKVDWISQHSVFPDYFRQQFYDTGKLFPEFAANIGGGQNIYNFSYYGLYSPIVLVSYLLPFVKMADYLMAASIICLAASVILFYRWLLTKGFQNKICFLTALLFLLAGPMVYHSYKQIMFVNYMPFLCMALIGIDRHFEKQKSGLFVISIFLMILTSFYFSIGGMLVLVLYGIYRYVQIKEQSMSKITVSGFVKDGIYFAIPMLTAVLMSGILLIPTAMALMGREGESSKVSLIDLLLPEIQIFRFVYSPYGIGLTTLAVTVLITGLVYRKASERILVCGSLIILSVPLFAYFLNGGLYIRDKVMIPFLPLICYMTALYLDKQERRELSFAAGFIPYLLTLAILFLERSTVGNSEYWKLIVTDSIVLTFCFLIFYKKKYIEILIIPSVIFLFIYGGMLQKDSDMAVDRGFYEKVTDSGTGQTVQEILENEDGFYRLEQSGEKAENSANVNRIWNQKQYISSVYSSCSHSGYQKFRRDTFSLEQSSRNFLVQSVSKNPIFQRFMGVKYLISEDKIPGYERYRKLGNVNVYKNEIVSPVAYATNKVISEKEYKKLRFPYNQIALLKYAVVPDTASDRIRGADKDTDWIASLEKEVKAADITIPEITEKGRRIQKTDDGYHIKLDKKKKTTLDISKTEGLNDLGENPILFLQFQVKNNEPTKDISIWFQGVQNKLTSKDHIYYNGNTTFSYVVMPDHIGDKLTLLFGKGDYEITDIQCSLYNEDKNQKGKNAEPADPNSLYQSEFYPDTEKTKGNRIAGKIDVKEDGYFITTIPYDENFEVKVDGEETTCDQVNTAFLGFRTEKGEHRIEILYHAPGAAAGKICTLMGGFICIVYAVFQTLRRKRCLSQIDKQQKRTNV